MNTPSIKTIMQTGCSKAEAIKIKAIMQSTSKDYVIDNSHACQSWVRQCYNMPRLHELKLHAIDEILNTHGVEYFSTNKSSVYYCNAGDTYATTIMRVNGRYRVGCWGDIAEREI